MVTALQMLLEVCSTCAGPHDIVYSIKKERMLLRPLQSQGLYSTRVRLRNRELCFEDEFRYLGHVMTADTRNDKDIENNSGGKMQLAICWSWKFSFVPMGILGRVDDF